MTLKEALERVRALQALAPRLDWYVGEYTLDTHDFEALTMLADAVERSEELAMIDALAPTWTEIPDPRSCEHRIIEWSREGNECKRCGARNVRTRHSPDEGDS